MDLSAKTKSFGGTSLPKPDYLFTFTVVVIRTQVSFEIAPPVLDFCHSKHAAVQYSHGVNEPRSLPDGNARPSQVLIWRSPVPVVSEQYVPDLWACVWDEWRRNMSNDIIASLETLECPRTALHPDSRKFEAVRPSRPPRHEFAARSSNNPRIQHEQPRTLTRRRRHEP